MRGLRVARFGTLVAALLVVASSAAGTGAGTAAHSGQARWMIADLGTLGMRGEESEAVAINDRGQIVGNRYVEVPVSATKTTDVGSGFLWEKGAMRDLGTLAGTQRSWPPRRTSNVVAVNNRGQIAGASDTRDGSRHAFLWERGAMTDLGVLSGGTSTWPVGLNDGGEVAGVGDTKSHWSHAFLWRQGRLIDLGTLGGARSEATAINNRGQVVGWSDRRCALNGRLLQSCSSRPFLWRSGTMVDLGTLGGAADGGGIGAVDVNDRSQVVGASNTRASTDYGAPIPHAFLWSGNKMRDVNPLPVRGASAALVVNQRGDVVGIKGPDLSATSYHAFLWRNGAIADLGTLVGARKDVDVTNSSQPFDINDQGYVVGWSSVLRPRVSWQESVKHAFVWHDGVMTDLGTLPGDVESCAVAINGRNQIVGWSAGKAGERRAVVWTPRAG